MAVNNGKEASCNQQSVEIVVHSKNSLFH